MFIFLYKHHSIISAGRNWAVFILVRVSMAAAKHHHQKALWGGKGLFGLNFQIVHLRKKEVRTETQVVPEHGGRSWCRGHGEVLPTDLLPLACLEPRTSSLGMAPPTMGWALPYWSLIEKMPNSWGISQGWGWGISTTEASFSVMIPAMSSWHTNPAGTV